MLLDTQFRKPPTATAAAAAVVATATSTAMQQQKSACIANGHYRTAIIGVMP